jgi:choline-sulfatase
LEKLGLADNTRVIYTSDHGESMGRRGLWGKFTLYEESVAVPMILAGPGVPRGEVSPEIVSLVDCYPTIVEALGHELTDAERELPGRSLWPMVRGGSGPGLAFSEYHAVGSTSASYMLRSQRYKYIHHVGEPPQLFDLKSDPRELNDLSADPDSREVVTACERRLRAMVDPEGVDAAAKADQRVLIERHGGREKVLQTGTFGNTPVPGQNPDFHGSAG